MSKMILASASPRRKEILEKLGFSFCVIPSRCEEIIRFDRPEDVVKDLSLQKAQDVLNGAEEGDLVIGSDTVVAFEGTILGKPHSREQGFAMLSMIAGKEHQVYTGVTICQGKKTVCFSECTDVVVAPMTKREIEDYLDTGEYSDKAGAYGIQGIFGRHIKAIRGDYYNVMGLPANALYEALKDFDTDSFLEKK